MRDIDAKISYCLNTGECLLRTNEINVLDAAAHIIVIGVKYILYDKLEGRCFLPDSSTTIEGLFRLCRGSYVAMGSLEQLEPFAKTLDTYDSFGTDVKRESAVLKRCIAIMREALCDTPIKYVPNQPLSVYAG